MSDKYDVLKKEIVINAPVEKVYSALITPEQLIQWFPNIVTLEPKIGGKISFRFLKESTQEDKDHEIVGEIVVLYQIKNYPILGILQQSPNIIKILLLGGSLSN
jgi:hypothetical protein